MKFAFLVGGELRGVKKTIKKLYKYIADFYDADIIIVCQKCFHDDEDRLKLFNRRLKFSKLYDKPNPIEYFGIDSNIEFIIENGTHIRNHDDIAWRYPEMLQIIINMNEMSKVLKTINEEYDYYIFFRTDINILFPFPDKCLFKNFSAGVYSLEGKYCQFWGGQGMANYIHKNYIHNLLTACYDYIKSPTIDKGVINNFVNIYEIIPEYYDSINATNVKEHEKIGINQEQLFILAVKHKNLVIHRINTINYYYTVELNNNYTTTGKIKTHSKYNVLCKYEKQVGEAYENYKLWNNNYRWTIQNNKLDFSL
jgi:hypothetical protein